MIKRLIVFLILNFAALAIGGIFTSDGVVSDWYVNLNQAPWTPPGWVFGVAWTTIMLCFAVYMSFALDVVESRRELLLLYGIQWVLNVIWNPVFFYFHQVGLGLITITALTALVGYLLVVNYRDLGAKSLLLAPYFIWLLIATSLNGYIFFNNG